MDDMGEKTEAILDAGTFIPKGPDVLPFGVCNDSAAAIQALRNLADAMEQGAVHITSAQSGTTVADAEFAQFRIFIEYQRKPKW